jgi:hypothetical protein
MQFEWFPLISYLDLSLIDSSTISRQEINLFAMWIPIKSFLRYFLNHVSAVSIAFDIQNDLFISRMFYRQSFVFRRPIVDLRLVAWMQIEKKQFPKMLVTSLKTRFSVPRRYNSFDARNDVKWHHGKFLFILIIYCYENESKSR